MNEVIHMNHYYTDDNDKRVVYCKKENKVKKVEFKKCEKCPYIAGALQGEGIECAWDDPDYREPYATVTNPYEERMRVARLIDEGKIKKG